MFNRKTLSMYFMFSELGRCLRRNAIGVVALARTSFLAQECSVQKTNKS